MGLQSFELPHGFSLRMYEWPDSTFCELFTPDGKIFADAEKLSDIYDILHGVTVKIESKKIV